MTTQTTPYNPFDYLESKEEINEYLNKAVMDDDPRVFIIVLGSLAKKKGMAQVAKERALTAKAFINLFLATVIQASLPSKK